MLTIRGAVKEGMLSLKRRITEGPGILKGMCKAHSQVAGESY